MNSLTRSALIRTARTLLQLAAGFLTVEIVQGAAQTMGARWHLGPEESALLVGAATLAYSYLHRRFLDPSRVPSLTDNQPA